jgi:hypothetical protein
MGAPLDLDVRRTNGAGLGVNEVADDPAARMRQNSAATARTWNHLTVVARRERNDQRYYKQVRLYLGDVEEIERALNQVTGQDAGRFDFSNGTWEAENVAELATKGEGPFSEFEMKRYSPGLLSFTTHGSTARLYVSDADDLQLRGAYERIDSILTGAQRPLLVRWLYSMTAWCVLCLVTAAAGISAITIAARTLRGDGPPGTITGPPCTRTGWCTWCQSRLDRPFFNASGMTS